MKKWLVVVAMVLSISACSVSIEGQDYEKVSPTFSIRDFFDGNVKAWGIVQNRSGKIVQRFTVDIDGRIEDNVLVMDESFNYGVGDGPLQRTWKITQNPDGTFTGNAGDIKGPAKGVEHGNAFHFSYEMDLPVDDTTYLVTFDDWFWAFDNNTMMNRSYIRKFGLVMAEVTIFMQKQ